MKKLNQIVIIDDHQLSGVINEMLIMQFNCVENIVVFDDPFNAIDYFTDLKNKSLCEDVILPELVLTDFNMPGLNGFEVIQAIKNLDLPQTVNCCILSASIERIDPIILEKHQVLKQLSKPLEKKEFMEVLGLLENRAEYCQL